MYSALTAFQGKKKYKKVAADLFFAKWCKFHILFQAPAKKFGSEPWEGYENGLPRGASFSGEKEKPKKGPEMRILRRRLKLTRGRITRMSQVHVIYGSAMVKVLTV